MSKSKENKGRNVRCNYCGGLTEFVDSAEIYNGTSYGMIYLCRSCRAYVGVHKGTNKPLGRLADAQLRYWKKKAHDAFDPIWKYGKIHGGRNAAYAWLAKQMGLPKRKTHIGMFDVDQCKQVISIVDERSFLP